MTIAGRVALLAVLALSLVAMACSSGSGSGATATPTAESATPANPAGAPMGTLPANNASVAELTAAFEAAGISNASQWAHEVEEYRPYPADDPDFVKLRGELAKYNPPPGVIDAIIAQLELP